MSNMQRCEQGHFYDASTNRRCPLCGVAGLDVAPTRPRSSPFASAGAEGGTAGAPVAAGNGSARAAETRPQRSGPGGRTEGRTVAFWHRARQEEAAPAEDAVLDPVVGWLVAIEGPRGVMGRDYRIYSEGNPIGRENHHRVVIKDESVSRDVHAVVTFDPRSEDAAYYLQPGVRHVVYLNDQIVLASTRLNPYDIIHLGKTKLLFVPLCNERFRWEWSLEDQ